MTVVRSLLCALAGACCLNAGSGWAGCVIQSAPYRVTLLELYTSEGCNSCPPADRWISALPQQAFVARKVVPLAFHVDYWDQLGWADRFSDADFSARQRGVAFRNAQRVIYTPQVVLDGKDWKWRSADLGERLAAINRQPPRATIEAQLNVSQHALRVRGRIAIADPVDQAKSAVFVALFENRLSSAVTAGENRGRTLTHDFVVRHLIGPLPASPDGNVDLDQRWTLAEVWDPTQLGVAIFAQHARTGDILQAASRMLCP